MKLYDFKILTIKDEKTIFVSKVEKLYCYNVVTNQIEKIYKFKPNILTLLSNTSNLFRRLFRTDIRYAIQIDFENLLLVRNKKIYRFNNSLKKIEKVIDLPRGSRPLNMTKINSLKGFDDGIYFGEYFYNPKKNNVKIYHYLNDTLNKVYEFPSGTINHIHNIIIDRFRDCLWILCGDFENGASIYKAEHNFQSIVCIGCGNQNFRSCVAFPTEEGLVYATDSQFNQNTIRLLYEKNNEWISKSIHKINGPCIYGTKIEGNMFFSTSVETINSGNFIRKYLNNKRSQGIIKNQSEIVSGNLQSGFNTLYKNEKDRLPFLLFQFGNILFPSGDNIIQKLIFTNIALKKDDFTTIIQEL